MNKEEEKLVIGIKDGDNFALKELFHIYYQRLFIYASKFVKGEDAKDFIQDCFIYIWQNRSSLNIQTSISSYLFTIIRNRCFKHIQKQRQIADKNQLVLLELKQEELSFYSAGEQSILEFDINDRIPLVLESLPEKCKQVFQLSRFKGLSNKEIAEKFDISVKAVEKQITKALKIFREEFKDYLSILILLLINIFK